MYLTWFCNFSCTSNYCITILQLHCLYIVLAIVVYQHWWPKLLRFLTLQCVISCVHCYLCCAYCLLFKSKYVKKNCHWEQSWRSWYSPSVAKIVFLLLFYSVNHADGERWFDARSRNIHLRYPELWVYSSGPGLLDCNSVDVVAIQVCYREGPLCMLVSVNVLSPSY